VGSPEQSGVEQLKKFFDRSALRLPFQGGGHNRNDAFLNRRETDVLLIDKQKAIVRLQNDLPTARTNPRLLLLHQPQQSIQTRSAIAGWRLLVRLVGFLQAVTRAI